MSLLETILRKQGKPQAFAEKHCGRRANWLALSFYCTNLYVYIKMYYYILEQTFNSTEP